MKQLLHYESSNLHSSKYYPDKRELHVTFMNNDAPADALYSDKAGATWCYKGVTPASYEEFEMVHNAGGSVGKHFYNHIRSVYKGEPVE